MSFMKSYLLAIICAVCFLATSQQVQAQISDEDATALEAQASVGEGIFNANCTQCHAVHEKIVGPALKNVWQRWPSVEALTTFIKYPQKVIDSGDPYAQKLYKEYKQYMPNHDFLSDEEVQGLIGYISKKTKEGPAVATTTTIVDGPKGKESLDPGLLTAIITGLSVILVGVLVALALLISVLAKNLSKRDDLTEDERLDVENEFSLKRFVTHPAFIGVAAFIFISVAGQQTLDGLFNVGVQRGYAPEQPIPFSHKLHAGYYEIDCKYCHTGVEKSKSANIPSANICMNCHNAIRQESPNMQKIYQAIENDEPIQWVRVHNLPDLAYFNHSQHVKVAGIECETCHGDIKNMEVVQQHSLLTMGWCINCHRETEINADNKYYDRLTKIHEASGAKEPLHAEDMGGLECSKCHY